MEYKEELKKRIAKVEKELLLEQLKKLDRQFSEVIKTIEKLEYNDANDYIVKDYPFNKSLDEVACEVSQWVETVEESIEGK